MYSRGIYGFYIIEKIWKSYKIEFKISKWWDLHLIFEIIIKIKLSKKILKTLLKFKWKINKLNI